MYKIFTWELNSRDPNKMGYWRKRGIRKTKRGAAKLLRKMYSLGYDRDVSIYIEKV
jgi:hypothetical protein